MSDYQKLLEKLGACTAAKEEAGERSMKEVWETCERGDWLLWLAAKLNVDRKLVVWAACQCARTALKFVKEGEQRPLEAIETAERWTKGEATLDEVKKAAAAAADAAYAYAYAADAAYAYAAATAAAAYAAYAAAAYAAYAASAAAGARKSSRLETAKIVRACISFIIIEEAAKLISLEGEA